MSQERVTTWKRRNGEQGLSVMEGGNVVVEGEGGVRLARDDRGPQLLHLRPRDRVPDVAHALAEHAGARVVIPAGTW